jgi:hypothetical protein
LQELQAQVPIKMTVQATPVAQIILLVVDHELLVRIKRLAQVATSPNAKK